MSLLDVNLADRQELKILPDNEEVELRIIRAEETPNKNNPDRTNLALVFDVPDEPTAEDIRVWIPIPTVDQKGEDLKSYIRSLNRVGEFLDAFGFSPSTEPEAMVGGLAWAILREEENQMTGKMQNSVRRFIVRR